MSETSTQPTGQAPGPLHPQVPGNFLAEVIITLLTPMFLVIAGGNLTHAHAAAAETLSSYRSETQFDLIIVAKIIAFGLATISSLSRSMDDDLTLNQVLRLRSNANATDRSEHRNRQAIETTLARQTAEPPEPEINAVALVAASQQLQQQTAEKLATFTPEPAAAPLPAPATKTDAENQYAATWAASAAQIAAETAASLDSLPPDARRGAAIWVEVLNDLAKDFTRNGIPPRPNPGELGALFQGA